MKVMFFGFLSLMMSSVWGGTEPSRGDGFVGTGQQNGGGGNGLVYMEDNYSQFSGTVYIEDHDEGVSTFRLVPDGASSELYLYVACNDSGVVAQMESSVDGYPVTSNLINDFSTFMAAATNEDACRLFLQITSLRTVRSARK